MRAVLVAFASFAASCSADVVVGARPSSVDASVDAPSDAASPKVEWATSVSYAEVHDTLHAIGVGPKGEIVAVGASIAVAGATHTDAFAVRIAPDGAVLWRKTHDVEGENDEANGVALDDAGAWAVGTIKTRDKGKQIWVLRWGWDGGEHRVRTFGAENPGDDEGRAIAIASDGSIWIAGSYARDGQGKNLRVARLARDGTPKLEIELERAGDQEGLGLAIVEEGAAIVVGRDGDLPVAWKILQDGTRPWGDAPKPLAAGPGVATSVVRANDGKLHACGSSGGRAARFVFESNGAVLPVTTFDGELATGCAFASDGTFALVGRRRALDGRSELFLHALPIAPLSPWTFARPPEGDRDEARAVAADPARGFYLAGSMGKPRGVVLRVTPP